MTTTQKLVGGAAAVAVAVLLALYACSPHPSSSSGASSASSAPALSGAPVASNAPASQAVNPPTSTAPPANAGDVQADKSLGPGGPVNSPRRLHDSRDGERG